ncbi:MAG: hypothetical protein IIB19_07735, partial [Chloroflexi bacterium]|nr:hypothetical protein [Chloroflexota bacterium]
PTRPWAELAAASDFGVPQVYKGSEVYGPTYEAQGVAQWQELGFKAIVPALAAYDFSPQLMSQVYRRTPQPQGAVIWWDAYNADNNPGAWQSIRMAGEMGLAAAPYGHGRSLRGSRRRR